MNGTSPPWLQIVIAAIPLVAAVIAGIFALTNTVNRRVERLKNLLQIRKEYPVWLNPESTIELITLRELQAIDRATTPVLKWDRRFRMAVTIVGICTYIVIALHFLHIGKNIVLNPAIAVLGILIGAALLLDTNVLSKRREPFQEKYFQAELAVSEHCFAAEMISELKQKHGEQIVERALQIVADEDGATEGRGSHDPPDDGK